MRNHHTLLFMGAGEHSLRSVRSLKRRLSKAFAALSGLQQPVHGALMDEEIRERATVETEHKDLIRDLAQALLGSEIRFVAKATRNTVGE